jgi:hypothetical protein
MPGRNKKCKQNFLWSSSWEEATWKSGVQITFMNIIVKTRQYSSISYIRKKLWFRYLEIMFWQADNRTNSLT